MTDNDNTGKLIIVSAPSGSGKTSIVKYLIENQPDIEFSISATSRNPRSGEKDGVDYYFMTTDEFRNKIETNQFVEWEEVYNGTYYGTLRSEIYRIWNNGKHIIFDVDVKGGLNLKSEFGSRAISLYIKPPGINELRQRLIKRGTDNIEEINRRIDKAEHEMAEAINFDEVIINDNLDEACREALNVCRDFINNET